MSSLIHGVEIDAAKDNPTHTFKEGQDIMSESTNRSALVTGANSGLGFEASAQLAETGTQATFELASVIGTIVR